MTQLAMSWGKTSCPWESERGVTPSCRACTEVPGGEELGSLAAASRHLQAMPHFNYVCTGDLLALQCNTLERGRSEQFSILYNNSW